MIVIASVYSDLEQHIKTSAQKNQTYTEPCLTVAYKDPASCYLTSKAMCLTLA